MTASEFTKIIGLIRGAFPHIDRFHDDDVKDVWYECLNDLEYAMARQATLNVIKATKDFPPDIATIRSEYEELLAVERREQGVIKTNYDNARGSYPQKIEAGYAWEEWKARAKDGISAEIFRQVIAQYIRECEKANTDVMDFKKCVQTICRDSDGKIYFKDGE